jgi:Cof subfamily protein (haloacid dehalogenase superfamily)
MIKLLATDLDGTIVADLHDISPRTQAAIQAAIARGVKIVIATGRGYAEAEKFQRMLGLSTPVICYQGALIYDPPSGQVIAQQGLSLPATRALIDAAHALNLALSLHFDGRVYIEHITSQSRDFFNRSGTTIIEVNDLHQILASPPIKGMIVHPAAETRAMAVHLQTVLGHELNIFHSLETLIEITSPNVSKGSALQTLAAYYGLAPSEVMALGDQDNDVEMIAWAGLGVAMGNASAKAKAAANVIAPPLSEDGAAWAIEQFILGDKDFYHKGHKRHKEF